MRSFFSDVYEEAITGDQIFTLSKAIDTEGDVLVMDVYINQGDVLDLEISLPSTYHFYLFDTDGGLLYRLIDRQATDPAVCRAADQRRAGRQSLCLRRPDRGPQGRARACIMPRWTTAGPW